MTFHVYEIKAFPRLKAPVEEIFGFTYRQTLTLLTCTGSFRDARTHEERLVVYAELVKEINQQ